MSKAPSVMLVEDSPSLAEVYKQYLSKEDITLFAARNGQEAIDSMERHSPELVLLDLKLPDIPGEDVLKHIKRQSPSCSVIIITAHGSIDIAVDLMRLGANDFLQKPIDAARLLTTVRNCLENMKLRSLVANLSDKYDRGKFHGFIGSSMPMQAVYKTIEAASSSVATIFITGESGTGKEVCAEAIHKQSARKKEAFIALNCGAIPKDLIESEIFGHVKGAFTGALSERKGAAEQANNGTLFLDEIGEMDMDLQTKLLRFIQSGIVKKVGGTKEIKLSVRFICATNRDPLAQVQQGTFREDLYYRLNVVPIHLPPLRERNGDITQLAKYFLNKYSESESKNFKDLSKEVIKAFSEYDWPGNVRQLQNIIQNVVVLHDNKHVELKHLPAPFNTSGVTTSTSLTNNSQQKNIIPTPAVTDEISTHATPQNHPLAGQSNWSEARPVFSAEQIRPLAESEREIIEHAIHACDGNIPKAAALLEVSPSTIYRKKQAWN